MTARDTRTGGKHAARDRGAYTHAGDNEAVRVGAYAENRDEQGNLLGFGTARNWTAVNPATWQPFREFFEKFQRQTA